MHGAAAVFSASMDMVIGLDTRGLEPWDLEAGRAAELKFRRPKSNKVQPVKRDSRTLRWPDLDKIPLE